MNQFEAFLKMGFEHISDIWGYDHMLFIVTICAVYTLKEWKKVAVLVTAFTIGHSTTLALSALKIIIANASVIEVLIPVTILTASISNVLIDPSVHSKRIWISYLLALVFGFVHGMGFSNFFNQLMGDSMSIMLPLFAFNLGLEIGQLMIVFLFFMIYFILDKVGQTEQRYRVWFFSGMSALISIMMILERINE